MKGNFTLKSTQSFQKINAANTNRSKTKATYSFSKSSRFSIDKPYCEKNTYNGDTIRRKKSGAGIGYGKKSDFTKDLSVSPPSSKYNLKTNFQQNKSYKKGYSLGKGRDEVTYDSYVDKQICRVPSANRYNNQTNLKRRSPIFTMRKKTKVQDLTMTIDNQNKNPGPGQYNNPQIQLGSRASKFSRISYGTSRSQRFETLDNRVPGAGTYKQLSNLSNAGKYIVSAHKGGTKAKFDSEKRITKFENAANFGKLNPGPGNYKTPSQFGQYDGDIYDRFSTVQVPSARTRLRK